MEFSANYETDLLLLKRLQKNEEKALEELMDRYFVSLCRFCHGFLKNSSDCEDIVINLFHTLWLKRNSLQLKSNLKAYLFVAVKNNALKHLRKYNNSFVSLTEIENILTENSLNAFEELMLREKEEELSQWIENLPDKRRKIVKLNRYEDFTSKEIAEQLNISEKTVINQLRLATLQLQRNHTIFED